MGENPSGFFDAVPEGTVTATAPNGSTIIFYARRGDDGVWRVWTLRLLNWNTGDQS